MCGIVGYVGPRPVLDVVVEGLRRLEYRGYDSSGVAVIDSTGTMQTAKKAGRIENLDKELATLHIAGTTGMGHTRWATHGAPNDRNAHPHTDASGRIAVVHNGIIENFSELRIELEAAGVEFASETDTETVAHLVAATLDADPELTLAGAVQAVCRRLVGSFTLVLLDARQPDVVVAARRNSPLVVGIGDGENDHSLFDACGLGVAVANAVPALKERAAWVTKGARGDGVIELIERILRNDVPESPTRESTRAPVRVLT